jgi:hypothetical protein
VDTNPFFTIMLHHERVDPLVEVTLLAEETMLLFLVLFKFFLLLKTIKNYKLSSHLIEWTGFSAIGPF